MPGERILATIYSEPFFGQKRRFCVTNHRVLEFTKKILSWRFFHFQLSEMNELGQSLDEGILKADIILYYRREKAIIPDVDKNDAREFIAALEYAIGQNHELLANQTKTCPDCGEVVKLMAKKCKYCGYRF